MINTQEPIFFFALWGEKVTFEDVLEQFPPPKRLTGKDFSDNIEREAYVARLDVLLDMPDGVCNVVVILRLRVERDAYINEYNQTEWTRWRRRLPAVVRHLAPRIRPLNY